MEFQALIDNWHMIVGGIGVIFSGLITVVTGLNKAFPKVVSDDFKGKLMKLTDKFSLGTKITEVKKKDE